MPETGLIEVRMLALAGLLGLVQLVIFAVPANLQLGSRYLAGPRDEGLTLGGPTARLQRAFQNHVEGLVFFTIAVVAVVLSGRSGPATETAAAVYLAARIAYVPAYGFGIRYLRSAIWAVGIAATTVMLVVAAT